MNCPLCPLVSNGHIKCPFKGQNGHVQWTQWTSIGSILMCPIDPLTALQLVNWPFLVNPVQWTQCVHCAHCVHCTQCKWMSNGQNRRPMDTMNVHAYFMTHLGVTELFFIVICDLCRPVSWFPCYSVCEAYIFLVTYKIHKTRGSVCIE